MPRTGGFRKLRWADARRGKGKRGGLRVIYYWLLDDGQFWMFAVYDKDELENLTSDQEKSAEGCHWRGIETTRWEMKKRNLFAELMQGVNEMGEHREGKITLRQYEVEALPVPEVTAAEIVSLREKLHMSQPVFARKIRTSPDTLKNWEQSKSKPNAQAALLIKLVQRFPDMVERLNTV